MVRAKMMHAGESWIGEFNGEVLPRKGEVVILGSGKGHRVVDVYFEGVRQPSGTVYEPLLVLDPNQVQA